MERFECICAGLIRVHREDLGREQSFSVGTLRDVRNCGVPCLDHSGRSGHSKPKWEKSSTEIPIMSIMVLFGNKFARTHVVDLDREGREARRVVRHWHAVDFIIQLDSMPLQ